MPTIESPYKPKGRRQLPRLLLSLIGCYLVFRSFTFLTTLDNASSSSSLIPFQSCSYFDHGDTTSPDPNVNSIFNCNSPSGTCKYHYPARFFDADCGVGREYAFMLEDAENMRLNATLWRAMPPIIMEWVSLYPGGNERRRRKPKQRKQYKANPYGERRTKQKRRKGMEMGGDRSGYRSDRSHRSDRSGGLESPWNEPHSELADPAPHIFPTHNISMVHVHKTGGTSLVFAFGRLHERLHYEGKMHVVLPQSGPHGTPPDKYSQIRESTGDFIHGAVRYQSTWGKHEHTIFAVVRDPVERFISSIGQATGGSGSGTRSEFAHELSKECLDEETARSMLSCFVKLVKTHGTWTEMHFTPMVVDISFSTMYKDVPVAVFPFNEIPHLLEEFDADPNMKRKNGAAHGHRKNSLLTDMNIDDYDEESLRDLCDIYRVDVLFLWHLGYATRCDDYVSFA